MHATTNITVDRADDTPLVSLGARFAIPERFTATVTEDDPTVPICHLAVAMITDRPTCQSLTIEARPGARINGEALRRVPLATYLGRAVDLAALAVFPVADPTAPVFIQAPGEERQRLPSEPFGDGHVAVTVVGAARTAEVKALLRREPRAVAMTDEALREVADVYRAAHARKQPPTKAVMQEWHVERSTASRWIRRARDAGHLGPARPRAGGEVTTEPQR